MVDRGDRRLENPRPEAPPGLEFLFASHVRFVEPLDIGSIPTGRRLLVLIEPGGRIEGPRLRGTTLTGSHINLLVRTDGVAELEGNIVVEMDDGELIRAINGGIRWMTNEATQEAAEGRPYDPAWLYSRSIIRFEAAADGPHAWLNRALCITKSTRTLDGSDSTVWQIV